MNTFVQRFLSARDGDLSPFDSWRRRKSAGVHTRFEVCFVKPLEALTDDDFEDVLLVAAESKAQIAWAYARFSCASDDAVRIGSRLQWGYYTQLRTIIGPGGVVHHPGYAGFQVPLFHLSHKPLEDHKYATLEQVAQMFAERGFKQT